MKKRMSVFLVTILIITAVLPGLSFAAPKNKSMNMNQYEYEYQYNLASNRGRIMGLLPYGLAKRGFGNLPPGLQKKFDAGTMPKGLGMEFHIGEFDDYIYRMLIRYNASEEMIDAMNELLDESPMDKDAIYDLLDEIKADVEIDDYADWVIAQAEKFGADQDQIEYLENLLDQENEEDIDKDAIEDYLDDLEEAFKLAAYIAKVNAKLDKYDASESIRDAVADLLDEDKLEDIDKVAINVILEQLEEDYEDYEEAMELYEDLVEDIDDIIDEDDFGLGDTETEDSFIDTFEEANLVLQALLDYLDDPYTISEGLEDLDVLKVEMNELLNTPEGNGNELTFGEDPGEYDVDLEALLEVYVDDIDDIVALADPELFDIIVLIAKVQELLDTDLSEFIVE